MTDIDISPKYSEVKPEGFYVYLHRRKTDNSVFYIGKGKGFRGWRGINYRGDHWNNIAKKNGVIVEVFKDGMSEYCAFTLEKIMIGVYGIDNLCNISLGGDGKSGIIGPLHQAYNDTIYEFVHKHGEWFNGTMYEFRMKYNIHQSLASNLVNGVRKSTHGWRLKSTRIEDTGNRRCGVWNYDKTEYEFFHKIKGVFKGTKRELIEAFNLPEASVYGMVSGKFKISGGWCLDIENINGSRSGKLNPSYDQTVRTYVNKLGDIFTGTQYEFRNKFDLDFRGVSGLHRGVSKTHRGWSLYDAKDTQRT